MKKVCDLGPSWLAQTLFESNSKGRAPRMPGTARFFGVFLGFLFTAMVLLAKEQSLASIQDEGVLNVSRYLSIDTTNPPGNEMKTARFLKQIADQEGIDNQIFDLGSNRANFLATLPGDGSKRAIVLYHHMDVVPAEPKFWSVPPFSGKILKGEIYGRGAIDVKAKGIIDFMALIYLKRQKIPLSRTIYFLAVADEEEGSIGTRSIIKSHPDLLRSAEFLIDEGETIRREKDGRVCRYPVAIGEKFPFWVNITFKGEPGHGSIPNPNSSVNRLIRASNRILQWEQPPCLEPFLLPTVETYLEGKDLRKLPGFSGNLAASLKNPVFVKSISENAEVNACLHNTLTLTTLQGSNKINTIPNQAVLGIDCRLLPGVHPDLFLGDLKKVVGDDTAEYSLVDRLDDASSTFSPVDSEFMTALKKCTAIHDPGAVVTPVLLLSSTDSLLFTSLGIHTYGFEPYRLTEEEVGLCHNNDERMSVDNVKFGIRFQVDFFTTLCGKRPMKKR